MVICQLSVVRGAPLHSGISEYASRIHGQGNRMKKPADKTNLRYLPGVCSPIREKGDNQLNGLHRTTKYRNAKCRSAPDGDDLPHPSPFSPHAFENNEVMSIMTRNGCENRRLTTLNLRESATLHQECSSL
jgi:hypothetical protein